VEPATVAQEKHNAAVKEYEKLAKTVNPATKEFYLSQTQLKKAVAESERELENAKRNAGLDHMANGLKIASYQATNLGYQLNDVVSGLLMGQSPFTIITQQGGQVVQILKDIGGGGGLVAGAGAAWQKFTGLFTAGRVAIGGTVGVVAGLTYEMVKQYNAGKTFEQSLAGVGKASGATAEGLMAASNQVSKFGDISITAAQGIINSFAKTGQIGQEQMIALGKMTKDFAYTAGLGLSDAGDELGKAMSSLGTGGIEELEKRVGSFTVAQHDMIEALARGGDKAAAQSAAMRALGASIADASASLTSAGKLWDEFWKNVSKGASLVGQAANRVVAPTPEQQLSSRQKMGTAYGATPSEFDFGFGDRVTSDPTDTFKMEFDLRVQKDLLKTRAEVAKQAEDSVKASKIVDGVYQEAAAYRKLTADIKVVNKTLDENAKRHNLLLGDRLNATEDTAASLRIQREAMLAGAPANDPAQARVNRAKEDIANQKAVINALGQEQLKAAVTQQTLTEARRNGAIATDQQIAVDKALTPIIEQQNVAARNRTIQHEANLKSISAFTQGEIEAAAATQAFTAVRLNQGTVEEANLAASQAAAEVRTKDLAQVKNIERAHAANMQAIQAETQAQVESAAAAQAAAQHPEGSAAAETAAAAARAEAHAKDLTAAREIHRMELANIQAIQARTVAERQAAAAAQAAAQHPIGSAAGAAAATAASNQVLAEYNRQQEDATRIGIANVQMIMAKTTSQRAAAASAQELADGTEKYAQAEAAANAVRAEAAAKARDMVDAVRAAVQQTNIQTAVVNRQISPEVGAFRGVQAQGEAQIQAAGPGRPGR
jgi:hypothetical protein